MAPGAARLGAQPPLEAPNSVASVPSSTGGSCPASALPCATGSTGLVRGVPLATTGSAWARVDVNQPLGLPPLRGASLAYDPIDNYLVLFGGCSPQGCPAPAQTWKFAGGTWSNLSTPGTVPPARAFATMAYDSKDGYVLLFGGWAGGNRTLNDTWAFVGGVWTNLTSPAVAPPPLAGARMTNDHADGYVVLFGGGTNATRAEGQTWRFSAGLWKNLTGTGGGVTPPARTGAGFAWDDNDGYALLFGGQNATGAYLGDSWTFLHGRWSPANLTGGSPPARAAAMLSYFGQDSAAYLFGGIGPGGPLGDTWKYATGKWTNLTSGLPVAPAPRVDAAALDSAQAWSLSGARERNGFLLLVGGGPFPCPFCSGPLLNDTWVFEPVLHTQPSVLPSVVEVGQPAVFSAVTNGGSPPYIVTWQFGDGTGIVGSAPAHAFLRTGVFTVNETATDLAGVTTNGSLTISVLPGPSVTVSVAPTTTDVGRPVSFTASPSVGTPPYTVRWNFGDLQSASGTTASHTYASPGPVAGNATVTDAVGGIGVAAFTVRVNPSLTFVVVVPTAPFPEQTNASFHVSVNGGTPPYSVNWTFGDGAYSSAATTGHLYEHGGSYAVRLSVLDAVGAGYEANYTVFVTNATGPSAPAPTFLGLPLLDWAAIVAGAAVAGILGLLLVRRRRRRSPTESPIAAAAVGVTPWKGPEGEPRSDSRSARRTALRGGRR